MAYPQVTQWEPSLLKRPFIPPCNSCMFASLWPQISDGLKKKLWLCSRSGWVTFVIFCTVSGSYLSTECPLNSWQHALHRCWTVQIRLAGGIILSLSWMTVSSFSPSPPANSVSIDEFASHFSDKIKRTPPPTSTIILTHLLVCSPPSLL